MRKYYKDFKITLSATEGYSSNIVHVIVEKEEKTFIEKVIDRPITRRLSSFLGDLQNKYNLDMYPIGKDLLAYSMIGSITDEEFDQIKSIVECKF